MQSRTPSPDSRLKMFFDAVGNQKLRIFGPAVAAFGQSNFFFTERFAVRFRRVLFMRRAVADVTIEDDERRPASRVFEYLQGALDAVNVISVADPHHIP